jgi:limonene-1,2-epoxide hydrolase
MSADSMPSKAIDVVRAFIAAINRRNPAEISALMTDDHTFVDSGGRIVSGRQTMITGWTGYFRMFPDYEIRIDSVLADDQRVAVFGLAAGTFNGKRGLVPENRIEMPAAWQAIVTDGKIKHWQVYADWTEGCRIMAEDQRTDQNGTPGRG